MTYPLRYSLAVALLVAVVSALIVGCGGSGQGVFGQGTTNQGATNERTDSASAPSAPEPADSPQPGEDPAGQVVQVGNEPEGVVADSKTGLVAVGIRSPNQLALVDGSSGDVVQNVDLPGAPRHLQLAAPGGPVLVPAEKASTLVQISLPDGNDTGETTVGANPHDATATQDGRIFVGNEFSGSVSVVDGDREVDTVEAPLQPGGVAATDNGKVGVVGVRGLAMKVFDGSSLETLGRVDAGEGPTHVVAGSGEHFYVVDTRGDAILAYKSDPAPEQTDRASLSGGTPYGVAIDRQRNQLWVTLTATNQVVRFALDGDSLRELDRYPTVRQPNTVAVDENSGRVYVTGSTSDGELQIIEPSAA